MNIKLFLAITFAVHFLAFLFIYFKKQEKRYILLCGTFAFLTVIYILKFEAAFPHWGPIPVIILLRVFAIGCTATYLYLSWPKISNFLRKRSSGDAGNAAN